MCWWHKYKVVWRLKIKQRKISNNAHSSNLGGKLKVQLHWPLAAVSPRCWFFRNVMKPNNQLIYYSLEGGAYICFFKNGCLLILFVHSEHWEQQMTWGVYYDARLTGQGGTFHHKSANIFHCHRSDWKSTRSPLLAHNAWVMSSPLKWRKPGCVDLAS